jgi:hypothetical protein
MGQKLMAWGEQHEANRKRHMKERNEAIEKERNEAIEKERNEAIEKELGQ